MNVHLAVGLLLILASGMLYGADVGDLMDQIVLFVIGLSISLYGIYGPPRQSRLVPPRERLPADDQWV